MRKTITILVVLLILSLITTTGVFAISNGEPDDDQHPMVGAMFVDFDRDGVISGYELLCSGSYAGPSVDGQYDVFLTAGHCVVPAVFLGFSEIFVSFDNEVLDADGPANLIASDTFYFDPHSVMTLETSTIWESSCCRLARWWASIQ